MSLMDEFIKIYAVFPARVHIVALWIQFQSPATIYFLINQSVVWSLKFQNTVKHET